MEENKELESLAIIMDGNRRWAKSKGLSTAEGHSKGAKNVETIAKYCNKIGIKYLTLYTFSTENWKRSEDEVKNLMILVNAYLDRFLNDMHLDNIRLKIIGDLDTIPPKISEKMKLMMEHTKNNTGLNLNLAFNYGGRAEILKATKEIAEDYKNGKINLEDINENLFSSHLYTAGQKDPDLLIRTSGEQRTSNFLPWQITYSEFLFMDKMWPDFTEQDIDYAKKVYASRHRRLGK